MESFGGKNAQEIWDELHGIVVDEEGYIEEDFYQFGIGTDVESIWHSMESHFDIIVGKMKLSPL